MKYLSKIIYLAVLALGFAACEKVGDLPFYNNGAVPTLTVSATTIAPPPTDSLKPVLSLNWTFANHSTDSANVKYVIEIDSAGRNFSKATTITVLGPAVSKSLLAKELNAIALSYGFAFNVAYDMDVRVTSSYANNNERLTSNTIRLKVTPYKIPPKIALPTTLKLFLVGDASQGGWNNPVPVPTQEFARIDETTWGGVFDLIGGKQYLVLPANGDWSHKFAVADNSVAGLSAGGDFGYDLSQNFPGPAASGKYKIILDFQYGKFTVTPYSGQLPANLFAVGDATPGGWSNPVPVPSQQFTRLNSSQWELAMPVFGGAGKEYLVLPVNGDWSNKFSVPNKTLAGLANGGVFGYNLNDNFPSPATAGRYKILLDFVQSTQVAGVWNYKFTVTPY